MIWNVPSKGPFLQFIVPCMSIWECVQENSFLPLIFSRGKKKVILFSFRRASLWGPNQSKFPLCFLLWRGLLLLIARPPGRPSGAVGCGQSFFREHSPCFGIDTISPPLSSTPVYLARLSIFPSVYHHSDVLQRQTFLGLLWGKLEAHAGHVQPGESAQTVPPPPTPTPQGGLGGDAGLAALLHLYLGLCLAFVPNVQAPSWCLFGQRRIPGGILSPFLTQSITHPHRLPFPVPSTLLPSFLFLP